MTERKNKHYDGQFVEVEHLVIDLLSWTELAHVWREFLIKDQRQRSLLIADIFYIVESLLRSRNSLSYLYGQPAFYMLSDGIKMLDTEYHFWSDHNLPEAKLLGSLIEKLTLYFRTSSKDYFSD